MRRSCTLRYVTTHELKVLVWIQCSTIKVVERDYDIKVHSKDLSQLVHQC